MSIVKMLTSYGFVPTARHTLYWGIGSLVWGYVVEVRPLGGNRYEVQSREWFYSPDGDCLTDKDLTEVVYGGEVMARAMATIPATYLFRRR